MKKASAETRAAVKNNKTFGSYRGERSESRRELKSKNVQHREINWKISVTPTPLERLNTTPGNNLDTPTHFNIPFPDRPSQSKRGVDFIHFFFFLISCLIGLIRQIVFLSWNMATSAANCWPLAGLLSSNRIHILNMCTPLQYAYLGTLIVIISSFARKIDVLVHIYFSGLSTCFWKFLKNDCFYERVQVLINFKQRMRFDGSGGHVFFYIFVAIAVYNEVERKREKKKSMMIFINIILDQFVMAC